MRQTLNKITTLILKFTLPVTIFLIPIFFLPTTTDFFTPNKQLLLTVLAATSLLAWSIRLITKGQLRITLSPALLPLLILAVVYFLSATIQNPNSIYSLLGRTNTIVALVIIFLTTSSTLTLTANLSLTISALVLSIVVASIFTIYQFLGLSGALTDFPWLQTKSFNLVGGPLPFLTLSIPTLIASVYLTLKLDQPGKKLMLLIASAVTAIASVLAISLLLPKEGQPQLIVLPYSAGWVIAVDIFKNLRTALIGTGPESFANVYSQLKPAFINRTNFWNLRFGNSSNEYFHLLTTVGLIGVGSYLFATIRTLNSAYRQTKAVSPYFIAARTLLASSLIIQIFFPASLPLLTLTFISLALTTIGLKTTPNNSINDANLSLFAAEIVKSKSDATLSPGKKNTEILPWLVLVISLVLIVPTGYVKARAYMAESIFYNSIQAAANNRGTDTYNLQIESINLMPQDPRYRISYSQTNLALANALASQGDLSDEDRSNITQLIQQAIREAKAATTLDPLNPATWQNLANIYRQLINLAQGSDAWTVAAYTQAIALDPINPQLRLDLGGVYYSLGNYDQAIRLFTQATEAKPDWANAYFNLSAAYRDSGQNSQALQAMRIVVELLDPTSPDYQLAQDELSKLETLANTETPTEEPTETEPETEEPDLITPTPLPSPTIEPIQLPDGSGIDLPPAPESTQSAQ